MLVLLTQLTGSPPATAGPVRGCGNRNARTIALLLLTSCLLLQVMAAGQVKEIKRVLILNDLGITSSPGFAEVDQAVLAGLEKSPYHIELYEESLELTLFPDEVSQRRFRQEFVQKYSERKPDVVIAAGSDSLKFIADLHENFMRDTPVIFCAILGEIPGEVGPEMHATGVLGKIQPEETLKVALMLLPRTKHVVVTGGTGKFDYRWEALAKESFRNYESKLDFTYLTDLTMPKLQERLSSLPSDTIIYHTAMTRDAAGERFIDSTQALPLIASAANAPIFVIDDVDLRKAHGEKVVGGDLVNWADDAYVAAGMAVRVLNGERPQDIPIVRSNNEYMFEWRALERWGIREANLPPGSIVLNRQPGFWEQYKQYVLLGIFILLVQAMAILGLLWQRARRRKIEGDLRRSEEKFSKSFRHSPLAISISSMKDGRFVEVNETFEELTGWRRDEVAGRTRFDINLWVDPDWGTDFLKDVLVLGSMRDLESKIRRKDGQIRTAFGSAELIEVEGEKCCLSVWTDITERKQAEEALANVSHKLIEAQEKERTRIARELHDDINQRIALATLEIEQLKLNTPGLQNEFRTRLNALGVRLQETGMEVQAISHRLHSSKLEILGVVAACKSFCREIAEQHKIEVQFSSDGVPRNLPPDVSLTLFRVLQESLQNAIKHSGAEHFGVQLRRTADEVELTVRDDGAGFDVDAVMSNQGLGLISMRERVSLVNGTILITSKPMGGTEVNVRVPAVAVNEGSKVISGVA